MVNPGSIVEPPTTHSLTLHKNNDSYRHTLKMKNLSLKSKILGLSAISFSVVATLIIIPNGIYIPDNIPFEQSPAFFPTLLSLAIGVIGFTILALKESPIDEVGGDNTNLKDFAAIVLLFGLYYLLIETIGLLLASIFILYGFMKMFGAEGQIKTSVVAILIPVSLAFFFETFDVNFPLGIVTEWAIEGFGWD